MFSEQKFGKLIILCSILERVEHSIIEHLDQLDIVLQDLRTGICFQQILECYRPNLLLEVH